MNVARMQKLRAILGEVAEKNLPFTMETWIDGSMIPSGVEVIIENECGAACCAIGWYCLMAKEELRLVKAYRGNFKYFLPEIDGKPLLRAEYILQPIVDHFDISIESAHHLFIAENYFNNDEREPFPPIPIQWVIDRVDEFMGNAK